MPVTKQLLNGADVVPIFEQMSRERMSQGVRACWLRDSNGPHCSLDCLLHERLVDVMATLHASLLINPSVLLRE